MKHIVEFFKDRDLLFKKLEPVDLKSLGLRKRWEIFEGVDEKNGYVLVIRMRRKSRFLRKDAKEVERVYDLLVRKREHNYKKRFLLLFAPLCSHAKEELEKKGWRVYAFV